MRRILILSTIIFIFSFSGEIFSQETERMAISVNEARLIAVQNNLDIKLAQLDSKIKGTELSYKEAVFDTILSGEIGYTDDQRKSASLFAGTKSLTNNYEVGLDKKLRSGTDVGIDFTSGRQWSNSSYVSTNPYHESQVELSLTQPIAKNFFGVIDRGNIEIIKREIKNAELDSYIKIEDAMISAEKAYWKFVLSREEFRIKKDMLKKAVTLFNQYRRKLKIGLVETGDVLAAEANMHMQENNLLIASNALKSSEELLRIRLNLDNKIKLFPTAPLLPGDFGGVLIESMNRAFENRRDYISGKNSVEAKKIKLKMKSNSRFPEIDLKATFATNGIDSKYYRSIENIADESNPKYYIGVEFKYPLENNEAESEYEKAMLEKTKAIIELQKTERNIISDIDEKFRDVSVNRVTISKMQRIENLQRGKLFQEEKRFKYGRSGSDILIRYQEDLLDAELAMQKAYYDYKISSLELMGAEDSFLEYIGLE